MSLSKTHRIGEGFCEPLNQAQFIATKVVVIDKRNPNLSPQVFVLSPESMIDTDDLQSLKAHFLFGFRDGTFIPMGEFQSIDRRKKLVKFPNEKLVSYEYLIVATTNNCPQGSDNVNEFFSGLSTLIDALRIKKQSSLSDQLYDHSRKSPPALEKKQVQILQDDKTFTRPASENLGSSSEWFFDNDIRLYEVQT